MSILIGLILAFGAILFLVGLMEGPVEAPETAADKLARVRERRAEITPDAKSSRMEREIDKEFARREEKRARQQRRGTLVPSLSNVTTSFSILQRLEEELLQARSPWRAMELLVASVFAALVVFIAMSFFMGLGIFAMPFALVCFSIPWLYVKAMKAKYHRAFEVQLADTLMLMANGLRAGFSFLQTLEMVSREAQPPVSDEFQRLVQEISIGLPVNQALENMAARVKSPDLDLVVTAVLIQREVGSSLAEILEVISGVIGERIRIRGEIRTLTAQGRLTGMLLGFLPTSLGILIHFMGRLMDPGAQTFVEPLITDPRGQIMLGIGLVMQFVGFLIILKIVSIKV